MGEVPHGMTRLPIGPQTRQYVALGPNVPSTMSGAVSTSLGTRCGDGPVPPPFVVTPGSVVVERDP